MEEGKVKAYREKILELEKEKENLKGDFYLQSKIEAHLELLCALGLAEITEQALKKKK